MSESRRAIRFPAELRYADELAALAAMDDAPRPAGWRLSPQAVRAFICGAKKPRIERKFFGHDVLVERAIVGLAGDRGLLLVGEPGTAKTLLSELLAAAISGCSTHTIQGSAGTTDDQIRYSWNYALLLAHGPSRSALVPAPVHRGLSDGVLVRFEELTRCPPEVQDSLVSVLSDKVMMIPELSGDEALLLAKPGFNVVATANVRDRGVHEMSAALKRRFNFETVPPIANLEQEVELVARECGRLLAEADARVAVDRDVIGILVTAFQDLREGVTAEGMAIERPSSVMSTAEAVSVAFAAGLDAFYYGDGRMREEHIVKHLRTAVLKDQADDVKKLRHYFDVVVAHRADKKGGRWASLQKSRKWLT